MTPVTYRNDLFSPSPLKGPVATDIYRPSAHNAQAVILAAGSGRRLTGGDSEAPPKALLEFEGQTLLHRHIRNLEQCGIAHITVVVGYHADQVRAAARSGAVSAVVDTRENVDFREGSILSLLAARSALCAGHPILLMDADVLCESRLLAALVQGEPGSRLLVDRVFEAGDEPVKLCVAGDRIVDFHKRPRNAFDWCGESVGFFWLEGETAAAIARRAEAIAGDGGRRLEYEDAIREVMLDPTQARFGFRDITGLPWIEIDFPEDVVRAREFVLPALAQ